MKIAIFGGSGFLGNYLCRNLKSNGYNVMNLSRESANDSGVKFTKANIHSSESFQLELRNFGPDIVISLSWITKAGVYKDAEANKQYRFSTVRLADFCYRIGVQHFIAFGSCAEYGDLNLDCDAQRSRCRPTSNYGTQKLICLEELLGLARSPYQRLTWLRIFQPYGLGQDQNRLIPWLIESLSKSADPVLSNPNDVADWIHASDIADAVLFAIQNTLSSVLDLGTSVPTLNLELKNVVAEMFPKFKFPAEKLRNTSINRGLVMSPRSELLTAGWRPQHDLFESVRSLAKGP